MGQETGIVAGKRSYGKCPLRQGMLCGNHNENLGATQGIVTSLLLLASLALRGGVLYGRTYEICV
jgi:hypothetical protein